MLGGAAVIAAVFAGMLVKKNADIEEQYRHSQKNESYALALLSAQYLKDGDRYAAVESALAALPQGDDDRRPASAAAEYALSNALYAYCDKEMRVGLYDSAGYTNSRYCSVIRRQSGCHR